MSRKVPWYLVSFNAIESFESVLVEFWPCHDDRNGECIENDYRSFSLIDGFHESLDLLVLLFPPERFRLCMQFSNELS